MFSDAQNNDDLPYYELPEASEEFTAGTMAARMIDALGFRFYWSTDSLTSKDLVFRANQEGKSTEEIIIHIYNLSNTIVNSTLKQSNHKEKEDLSYAELRSKTLHNLKTAADILRASDDISQYKIIFGDREIPFWNQINGPIADSIWHCGQIAINRRTTGNPMNPKVNHFTGKIGS
ncbi:hypothetical protein ADIWIN_2050 [Winogradskyella psychrotolerans RS-3]|uniref:DinB-like domain-containing protein n=1 Tax=Winogradskyella psychrotolerans RS-3 TaxID=641526 RepID=S7VUC2_9FLAO|nr:hypothetical protein [Winogradskyella psychrotolerans]EPR72962.1 hypothetical protein ADIWIN_2050 [Winogradskyella psychrotolerans RS-3]